MARKRREEAGSTLERGNIFFFYRPRNGPAGEETVPRGVADVGRSYLVLQPEGSELYRVLILGRKRLPDPSEREWAFVYDVFENPEALKEDLRSEEYESKTRGERVVPAARPAGEGVYALVTHADHTHLVYALELPEELGPVQRELRIEREASYIVSVKNPESDAPPEAGLPPDEAVRYPRALQRAFDGKRFLPVDPPLFLDYPGAGVLLIGASENVQEELGIELDPERETERSAEVLRSLHLAKSEFKVAALLEGRSS